MAACAATHGAYSAVNTRKLAAASGENTCGSAAVLKINHSQAHRAKGAQKYAEKADNSFLQENFSPFRRF